MVNHDRGNVVSSRAIIATGMPAIYADMLLGTFKAARRGDFAATDPALTTLLGRKPVSMREVIAASLSQSLHQH